MNLDIYKILRRTNIHPEVKNKITMLLSTFKFGYIVYNQRYEEEKYNFTTETSKVLVFEACAQENLRSILKTVELIKNLVCKEFLYTVQDNKNTILNGMELSPEVKEAMEVAKKLLRERYSNPEYGQELLADTLLNLLCALNNNKFKLGEEK